MECRFEHGMEYLMFPVNQRTGMVSHLMTTRAGGVSEGMCATMNLSFSRGDKEENVEENFRRIAALLGRPEDIVCSDQTHTTNIRRVTSADKGKGVVRPKDFWDVDGLITDEPGIVLATFYADCVPLLFVDPVRRAVGLSHSGWSGTAEGMGARTVEAMREAFGSRPEDLLVGIGPSICRDCYEVSEDVADAFWICSGRRRFRNGPVGWRMLSARKETANISWISGRRTRRSVCRQGSAGEYQRDGCVHLL